MAQKRSIPSGIGSTVKKTFSRTTSVSIVIKATPDVIWALLTNARDFPRWNSTITSIEGEISLGKKIRLKTTLDDKRTFDLKVVAAEPPNRMIWKSGQAPFFQGVRTYIIDKISPDTTTFRMTEKLSGLMFPMAAAQIPDFKESFEQYASDLRKEAETIMNRK